MKSVTFWREPVRRAVRLRLRKPRHGMHVGQPAIRMNAPAVLLAAEPRHNRVRGQVPGEANVECDLRMGLIAFKAKLVDMSTDGRAFPARRSGDPHVRRHRAQARADPQQRRRSDRGRHPGSNRCCRPYCRTARRATRIGCHIITDKERLEKLIRFFVIELR